jgi:hypothetical protein
MSHRTGTVGPVTLHLALVSDQTTVHASDRLVTYSSIPGEHDVFANKAIVLAAHCGIVSIGYTGLAYLGEIPTDEWIAEVLWREPLGPGGTVFTPPRPDKRRMNAGAYAELLRSSLATRFSELPARSRADLTVAFFGVHWHTDDSRLRPINWYISNSPRDLTTFTTVRMKAYPGHYTLRALPLWTAIDGQEALKRLTAATSIGKISDVLVGIMKQVAAAEPAVGPHTMVVAITPWMQPHVTSYFFPGDDAPSLVKGNETTPLAFSPWVVGRTVLMQPSAMGWADITTTVDDYAVRITGSKSTAHWFSTPQSRKRRPGPGESPYEPMVTGLSEWFDRTSKAADTGDDAE